ncbi:MAG: tetratricopeptide repeat protein [Thermodesulfobacteriota bacterium]
MSKIEEGVYEEVIVQTIGTGGTTRKQEIKNYYLVKPADENLVEVQLMDMYDQPLPIVEKIPMEDFRRRFKFIPDYLARKKSPVQQKIDKAIATAETHYRRREFNSAEYEYTKALRLDEENVRANFGIGKVYLATGETEKARETFAKLAGIEAVFEEKNKHIFNELGMELRKLKLYDEAVEYYLKALTIARDDENLFFNAARAYYEKEDYQNALVFLGKAFSLKPDHPEARQLLRAIESRGGL